MAVVAGGSCPAPWTRVQLCTAALPGAGPPRLRSTRPSVGCTSKSNMRFCAYKLRTCFVHSVLIIGPQLTCGSCACFGGPILRACFGAPILRACTHQGHPYWQSDSFLMHLQHVERASDAMVRQEPRRVYSPASRSGTGRGRRNQDTHSTAWWSKMWWRQQELV